MVGLLHRAGIQIVPGTDGNTGLGLLRELELYAMAGIPIDDVLWSATLGSAKVMKRDRDTGSIKVGKVADMFLVDGNVASDLGNIYKTRTVIKNGVVYDSARLYKAVGVAAQP